MSIQEREKQFYDEHWKKTQICEIEGAINIPCVADFKGKRVLICGCGTGIIPVQAAKQGAEVYAFDISETAVEKAKEMADYNNVHVKVDAMDFHNLLYENNFFDIIYGTAILHHVDCSVVGHEIYRVLKPGGIAFFRENSDKNPILRFLRRLLFGGPGGYQRQKFAFIKRTGTTDEYPLTEKEIKMLSHAFNGNIRVLNERFVFFYLLDRFIFRKKQTLGRILRNLDLFIGAIFPFIRKYSRKQEIWMKKPE
jgi:ubiquinone/menaquinone biosynthesis C-methylase UbiE